MARNSIDAYVPPDCGEVIADTLVSKAVRRKGKPLYWQAGPTAAARLMQESEGAMPLLIYETGARIWTLKGIRFEVRETYPDDLLTIQYEMQG